MTAVRLALFAALALALVPSASAQTSPVADADGDVSDRTPVSLEEVARDGTVATPLERALAAGGESLTLENGRGYAIVTSSSGTILGSIGRGRVVVTNYRRGPRTKISFSGCDTWKRISRRTVVCAGRNVSFSVVDGRWRVVLRGTRINASAVVEGSVTLEGTSGTYAIGDPDDKRPWPRSARTFRLG